MTALLELCSIIVGGLLKATTTRAPGTASTTARATMFTHTLLQSHVGSHLLAPTPQGAHMGPQLLKLSGEALAELFRESFHVFPGWLSIRQQEPRHYQSALTLKPPKLLLLKAWSLAQQQQQLEAY